ncbi:hypothetical protein GQ53DRAFT_756749 [Thozetella sp. PMI_491]|nr:hypothetical protein GQ53DRAFT_756749 [Thozetella sp. PMI_491]
MEPIGLAVGVVGLAGLFNTCLDAFDRLSAYKDFDKDSRSLSAQFSAERLRFQQWGESVGIDGNTVANNHHPALDHSETRKKVEELFAVILEVENGTGSATLSQQAGSDPRQPRDGLLPAKPTENQSALSKPSLPSGSRRQKISWALGGRAKHGPTDAEWALELRQSLLAMERVERKLEAENRRNVYAWLGHFSSEELYEDAKSKRLGGTCDWVLGHPIFREWLSPEALAAEPSQLLWINGAAGFGKTILCARIVDHLTSTLTTPVASFFLSSDFESREDPYNAVRAWITQIITEELRLFDLVEEKWQDEHQKVATKAVALTLLRTIALALPGCTFVLDGLDECTWLGLGSGAKGSISEFLKAIMKALRGTETRFLLVSRDEPDIGDALRNSDNCAELHMSLGDVQTDVIRFARSLVDEKLVKKDDATKSDLSQRMADRCEGQFLWLKMQEGLLRDTKNKKQLERIIDDSPPGLYRLYERNWSRILNYGDRDRTRTLWLLRWAAFAMRPLTVCEIIEAVVIDRTQADFPLDEMPDEIDEDFVKDEISDLCGSLLEIRTTPAMPSIGSGTVHLAHFSVRQFLLQNSSSQGNVLALNESIRISHEGEQNGTLAKLCLHYLSYPQAWGKQGDGDEDNQMKLSFYQYAAGYWYQHIASLQNDEPDIVEVITSLFDEKNPAWRHWTEWFAHNETEEPVEGHGSPLYYASRLGLLPITREPMQRLQMIADALFSIKLPNTGKSKLSNIS